MAMTPQFNAGGHRYVFDRGRYKRYGNQGSISATKSSPPPLPNQVTSSEPLDYSYDKRIGESRRSREQPFTDYMFVKQKTVK